MEGTEVGTKMWSDVGGRDGAEPRNHTIVSITRGSRDVLHEYGHFAVRPMARSPQLEMRADNQGGEKEMLDGHQPRRPQSADLPSLMPGWTTQRDDNGGCVSYRRTLFTQAEQAETKLSWRGPGLRQRLAVPLVRLVLQTRTRYLMFVVDLPGGGATERNVWAGRCVAGGGTRTLAYPSPATPRGRIERNDRAIGPGLASRSCRPPSTGRPFRLRIARYRAAWKKALAYANGDRRKRKRCRRVIQHRESQHATRNHRDYSSFAAP